MPKVSAVRLSKEDWGVISLALAYLNRDTSSETTRILYIRKRIGMAGQLAAERGVAPWGKN